LFIDRDVFDFLLRADGVNETLDFQLSKDRQVPASVWLGRTTQRAALSADRLARITTTKLRDIRLKQNEFDR